MERKGGEKLAEREREREREQMPRKWQEKQVVAMKDCVKREDLEIIREEWSTRANDRANWRQLIKKVVREK